MNQSNGVFNLAAAAALINGLLHIAGAAIAGIESTLMPIILFGVLWLLCAVGLKANKRIIAYLAFVLAIIGGLIAYSQLGPNSALTQWLVLSMALLDLLIAVLLFVVIWRRPADK